MVSDTLGQVLAEARRAGRKLADYPCDKPGDMAQAFAAQDAMAAAMGAPVVGWKVGLTSKRAQELCGVDQPLAGPVFAGTLYQSGAELALCEADLGVLEAEIGFEMKAALPARAEAYGRDEVLAAIGAVVPLFEWVNKRLPGGLMDEIEWIVADGVINRALIRGASIAFEPGMDLKGETVRVMKDGAEITRGVGARALGDPLEVMVWLANDLRQRGKGLNPGDVAATGLICDVVMAEPGARYEAVFGTLGWVALRVAP